MAAPGGFFSAALLVLLCLAFYVSALDDSYIEELFLQQTHDKRVYSHFEFTTKWKNEDNVDHYRLFPKSLGEVISFYKVEELQLTMTQGLWKYDVWRYPLRASPPGLQLHVWFKAGLTEREADSQWQGLVSVLGGMFCASINFIQPKTTLSPQMSFRREGVTRPRYDQYAGNETLREPILRYGSLPAEIVCTENLTPWMKLLPCGKKKGLALLFQPKHLYNSNYHSIGVHVKPVCWTEECSHTALELKQTLSSVTGKPADDTWSLTGLYGNRLSQTCTIADSTRLYMDITDQNGVTVSPKTDQTLRHRDREFAVHDLTPGFDLSVTNSRAPSVQSKIPEPPLTAHRFVTGYGQERGGIVTELSNHQDEEMNVILLENIPWFLRAYLNTLTVERNGTVYEPEVVFFRPGRVQELPYHLELILRLPPRSTTSVSIAIDKLFLKWTEYPPDANHGFYAPSAVVTTVISSAVVMENMEVSTNSSGSRDVFVMRNTDGSLLESLSASNEPRLVRVYTESLLISLPTPDFSMPFNVICLTCTVIAIAFGAVHNIATRQILPQSHLPPTVLAKVKAFLRRLVTKIRGQRSVSGLTPKKDQASSDSTSRDSGTGISQNKSDSDETS